MKKLLLATIIGGLSLSISGAALATEKNKRPPRFEGPCGHKCIESRDVYVKGYIPCICEFSFPDVGLVRLFRHSSVMTQGTSQDRSVGSLSANCNTGYVAVKLRSQNGALKNLSVADTYLPYDVEVGGALLNEFDHDDGTPKEYIWEFGGGAPNALNVIEGSPEIKVLGMTGLNSAPAGLYADRITITVSGRPL
ncbi:hypothetical protein BCT04_12245 [Vibrio breoganii]|uniref:hypothetical protein n=1 Tax=Vibrio breoganii TaxID=553239 RepID=UPI000C83D96F|nr:hypothetical protein [Vibrio breoganii]PML17978.1 hypothetical protein BCT84_04740 [Vibrio breoganii]PML83889.1 hypothetical protein BCT68_01105 [Vibrio breoganii]PMO65750.1 hypothetical protein BCT04_12245 [Vibrio breoganii]